MDVVKLASDLLGPIDFDPNELHKKYLAERDKRLRSDNFTQYIEAKGDLANLTDDPFVKHERKRAAVADEVEVTIIGGGFGGLIVAAKLRDAGFEQLRIVENASDFGGTWYWNRYPGAMCDVESYVYLPLLEELDYVPKHKYSFQPEIFEHCRNIARHYRLYDDALLQTTVTEVRWSDADRHWTIRTDKGDRFKSRFLILANGPLNVPKLPGIPGIAQFQGHTFHTSRWDFDYTGGDATGRLTKLRDKRIGIIGTGATAIQCIPHLGEAAKHLYVFQRTPSSIDVRNNGETDQDWAASLQPGWQKRRTENFTILTSGGDQDEDLVGDGWTDIIRLVTGKAARDASVKAGRPLSETERQALLVLADYQKMNQIRSRVDSIVQDPLTAEALKPWYRQFCKRPCFHDEYLQTFNRPNVTLIDTQGKGVERLTSDGIVVNGEEYKIDCLIFATGFETNTAYAARAGYEIIGRNGLSLARYWTEGMRTFQGTTVREFPNCFLIGRTQVPLTISVPVRLYEQAVHIAYILSKARTRGHNLIEPNAKGEEAFNDEMRKRAFLDRDFLSECTPGYYNSEGAIDNVNGFYSDTYGGNPMDFFEMLRKWRDGGLMEGLTFSS